MTNCVTSYLVPCVQQHDIILTEVVLREQGHLGHDETACLIGAFEQARLVVWNRLL